MIKTFRKQERIYVWETGGAILNRGNAQIVAGPQGERLRPFYVNRTPVGDHALFVAKEGYFVVVAAQWAGDYTICIHRVVEVTQTGVHTEIVATFQDGEWDGEPPAFLDATIRAAIDKARCPDCRHLHYSQ